VSQWAEAESLKYFGRTLTHAEWAGLVGAPDGATVQVGHGRWNNIGITTKHPDIHWAMEHYVSDAVWYRLQRSALNIEIAEITLNPSAPEGMGTRMLARQVEVASRLGVKVLWLNAAGAPGGRRNGYYTWPRLGFNHSLSGLRDHWRRTVDGQRGEDVLTELQKRFGTGIEDFQDLFAAKGGPEYWRNYGVEIQSHHLELDLMPGSKSLNAHKAYLDAKGVHL
jgi:hypothetical protein